ncbi:hypothetical protein [Amycolatopsis sp. 195334CR]|uniref:hypothetical protein n=1 Tax=Amycolatopsis sp. 195334CR TaxID=2814588 RepID=UPI001A8CF603|nr:hypothetical protein [Amycolatopsis sp. 195334CR]MBN6035576.1 hypothetical protein [Amycolatopsis sp. 195334CR]
MTQSFSREDDLRRKAAQLARKLGVMRWADKPGRTLAIIEELNSSGRSPDPSEFGVALEILALARKDVELAEYHLLRRARESGMSWVEIAKHLSVSSRQAAEQRFLRLEAAVDRSRVGVWRDRDPAVAREIRRRRRTYSAVFREEQIFLEEFADAILEYAAGPGSWDRLNYPGADSDLRGLLGQLDPYLRTLRTARMRGETERIFGAIRGVADLLERYGFRLDRLPEQILRLLERFRSVVRRVDEA